MEIIDTSKAKMNNWCNWNSLTFHSIEDTTSVLVKSSINDIKKIQVHKADIKDNSCLYFGKTSKFPRHKLKETSLKRCIKVEKSDVQVIGELNLNFYDMKVVIFSNENNIFIINLGNLYIHPYKSELLDLKSDDYIDRIKEKNKILENTVVTYVGEITILSKPIFEDLTNIENNIFNNVITDTELDIFINNNAESLTVDTCDLLYDLLNSKDYQSMELGLKMLVGFNVNECPNTIKLLLSNSHLAELKAWNSVGVNQVKNSIKNYDYFNYLTYYDKIENDLDKELSRYVWKKMSLKQIDEFASRFNLLGLVFKVYAE